MRPFNDLRSSSSIAAGFIISLVYYPEGSHPIDAQAIGFVRAERWQTFARSPCPSYVNYQCIPMHVQTRL
jgi:hypothetical protein